MVELRQLQLRLKTLDGKCLVDDICNEYALGVWTLFELRMGLANTYANAQGAYKQDIGTIITTLRKLGGK